jgi:hypothetical protein
MEPFYPIAKEGDIAVRIKGFGHEYPAEVGSIFKCIQKSSMDSRRAKYSLHNSAPPGEWRHATSEEITAFNNGCKNIKEINLKSDKQNEKTRIIESNGRFETKGTSISSSRTRQIATQSRPIGNTTSIRIQKTRIKSSKISRNIVSC